jgi:dinuclear metal center YbgI/SA1388 family protein
MRISDITRELEKIAPLALQESYDNSGLLVGNATDPCERALITLDCTEAVIDEAISKNCDLVIAHHPIIFGGLKKLNGKNYVERTVIKAIKNNVAIYAIHTNLDNAAEGVNKKLADKIGLKNLRVLSPGKNQLKKLVTFVPTARHEHVRKAIFDAGAGHIDKYDQCSYNIAGHGTFRAGEGTTPFAGKQGELHTEPEIRLETIYPVWLESAIIKALLEAHPYEEVAYDLYPLSNDLSQTGSGMLGALDHAIETAAFLAQLKTALGLKVIRYTPFGKTVQKVAICGGAGSFLLRDAIAQGADAFVTADFKYHQFFDAEDRLLIADVGHFESEKFTVELLAELIQKKFPKFALLLSETNTNPVNYYY